MLIILFSQLFYMKSYVTYSLGHKYHPSKKEIGDLKKILNTAKDKIKNYFKTLLYLNQEDLSLLENVINYTPDVSAYTITVMFKKYKTNKPFILYLTKKQIKDINFANAKNYGLTFLTLSRNQILNTFNEYQKISKKIESVLAKIFVDKKDFKIKRERKKDKEKDLIDFSDDLIPQLQPKKYKVLRNEDLIPTKSTGSPDGAIVLRNILNYPETKNILGLSLTPDLKEKVNKLDSEASFGVANIISSLITNNRGKMTVYSVTRKQLKEIIEGLITTLSVLLNPAQKL